MIGQHSRLTAVLAISVVSLFLTMTVGFADEVNGPLLVLPEKSFDFGYVPQNTSISHNFVLKNEGTDSLFILNIKPG